MFVMLIGDVRRDMVDSRRSIVGDGIARLRYIVLIAGLAASAFAVDRPALNDQHIYIPDQIQQSTTYLHLLPLALFLHILYLLL